MSLKGGPGKFIVAEPKFPAPTPAVNKVWSLRQSRAVREWGKGGALEVGHI